MTSTDDVIALLLSEFGSKSGLRWAHGQGSSVAGFTDTFDVDCVVAWEHVPGHAALSSRWSPHWVPHGQVVLEEAVIAGRDVDVLHLPEALFVDWISQLERGDGWEGNSWPSPLYSASGLAHGVVIYDPDGVGSRLQHRISRPTSELTQSTRAALAAALPTYAAELTACANRDDAWLHQHLCDQLMRTAYTAWFVAEGHLPPFPKHLSSWFRRLNMDPELIRREQRHWDADSLTARGKTLVELCEGVLDIGRQPTAVQ